MKRLLASILLVWFLVIQSLGSEQSAFISIPMQNEEYCKRAIEIVTWKPKNPIWYIEVQYNCIDAGRTV